MYVFFAWRVILGRRDYWCSTIGILNLDEYWCTMTHATRSGACQSQSWWISQLAHSLLAHRTGCGCQTCLVASWDRQPQLNIETACFTMINSCKLDSLSRWTRKMYPRSSWPAPIQPYLKVRTPSLGCYGGGNHQRCNKNGGLLQEAD